MRAATAAPPALSSHRPGDNKAAPVTQRELESQLVQARLGIASSLFTALRLKHADTASHSLRVCLNTAAWMLSLPEHAIRQAVAAGDVDRVFIGAGTKNYRIVYGSLLAWVNDMPRQSARSWW